MGRRAIVVASALVLAAGAGVSALGAGRASAASTVAAGVSVQTVSGRVVGKSPERIHLLHVDLSGRRVTLQASLAGSAIGSPRATVPAMARAAGAVAGVNGDFFDVSGPGSQPVGGIVVGGRLIKTPLAGTNANLYLTSSGHAGIGPYTYRATITRGFTLLPLRLQATNTLLAVNSLRDARAGRITYVDHDLMGGALHASCTVVTLLRNVVGTLTVTGVATRQTRIARPPSGSALFVACGGSGAAWLSQQLQHYDAVTISGATATPRMLVSGGRQLVRNGRLFTDPHGRRPEQVNPVTFACVSRNGLAVTLGTVDGRWSRSRGLSTTELARYLLSLHCWNGMTLDGGGSTTMVARLPHQSGVSVINRPSDGSPRRVADSVLVVPA